MSNKKGEFAKFDKIKIENKEEKENSLLNTIQSINIGLDSGSATGIVLEDYMENLMDNNIDKK